MAGSGLRIGSFAGAPIVVDSSFALTAAFFIVIGVMDSGLGALPSALVFVLGLVVAVLAHEFGHAATASALGLQNKIIAVTFFGGHVEFASPPKERWRDILITLAGPGANLAFAIAAFALSRSWTPDNALLAQFIDVCVYVNVVLGVFNLLPGFPLDGGRVLKSLLSYAISLPRARLTAGICGLLIASATAFYGATQGMVWTLLIALFLGLAAWVETRAAYGEATGRGGDADGSDGAGRSNA